MAAGRRFLNMSVVLAVAVAVMFQSTVEAATYVVGDATGWVIPTDNDAYDNWAAGKTFTVGDVLVFNFATGSHDVAQVTEQGEDSCDGSNPIRQVTASPANLTLTTAGRNYFICTFGGHCNAGQKLEIIVIEGARTPAPTPMTVTPSPAQAPTLSAPAPTPMTVTPSPAQAPTLSAPAPTPMTVTPSPTQAPTLSAPAPVPASTATTPPATATGPSPPGSSGAGGSPPPASSSAASLGVAGVFATLVTVGAAILF